MEVEALMRLLPLLSGIEQTTCVKEALLLTQEIDYTSVRRSMEEQLIPYLVSLPRTTLGALWKDILPTVASCASEDLLSDLYTLAPIIAKLAACRREITLVESLNSSAMRSNLLPFTSCSTGRNRQSYYIRAICQKNACIRYAFSPTGC